MTTMTEEETKHHHSARERLDAARAAAEEVVAEESGQLGGEVSALAVPFEQIAAAVSAAIHPDRAAADEASDESIDRGERRPDEPQPPAIPTDA